MSVTPAPSIAIPPPLGGQPWVDPQSGRPTQWFYQFMQLLWASIQGTGGLQDITNTTVNQSISITTQSADDIDSLASVISALQSYQADPGAFDEMMARLSIRAGLSDISDVLSRIDDLENLIVALRGVVNSAVSGTGTLAAQNANNVKITGGAIDGTVIGGTTQAAGSFTALSAATLALSGAVAANEFMASPSGGSGAPTFRAIVGADLPNPSAATLGGTQSIAAVAHKFLTSISTAGVPVAAQPAAADLSDGVTGAGAVVLATSPTLGGTVAFPDGATWSPSGLSDVAAYATLSTAPFNFSPTTSSSTTGLYRAFIISPTMTPTGATAGNLGAVSINATVGASALNVPGLRAIAISTNTLAGYTGVVALGTDILINPPVIGGTNPITDYASIRWASAATNGNGITAGSVSNSCVNSIIPSAGAAAGGTVTNVGILIAGNGGAGAGTTTNFAINSTSTAQSALSGILKLPHLVGNSATPAIAAGVGAGTGPTISVAGTDLGGKITLTSGTLPTAASVVATITFASAFSGAPYPTLTPANAATALLSGATMVFLTSTTATMVINSGTSGLVAATAYSWFYSVIG